MRWNLEIDFNQSEFSILQHIHKRLNACFPNPELEQLLEQENIDLQRIFEQLDQRKHKENFNQQN